MQRKSHIDLEQHLREEHRKSPFSTYLKEIVYGGHDGIVTTFAVVSGFTGAQASGAMSEIGFVAVLLFGFANLFADASSMGLGNFLAMRSERDLYISERKKELREIKHHPGQEKEETIAILMDEGYDEKTAIEMTEYYAKNPSFWSKFMMQFELDMEATGGKLIYNALTTFLSFIIFGIIPLLPYLFYTDGVLHVFYYSLLGTIIALTLLGILRGSVARISYVRAILEALLIGGTGALIAYFVGTFFAL